jgi:hypothetical protein
VVYNFLKRMNFSYGMRSRCEHVVGTDITHYGRACLDVALADACHVVDKFFFVQSKLQVL